MNSQIFNVECITSKTNSTIVKIAKLSNKKVRKEEQLFLLDGIKLFAEAFKFCENIKYVILNDSTCFDEEILDRIQKLKECGTHILCVSEAVFSKLTEENAPQGIITVCGFLQNHNFGENRLYNEDETIMAFESVRDPGNIGAIIRNAAAFGIERLIFSSDCADVYSQKVLRATMGAVFKVKIDFVSDFQAALKDIKALGRRVIATTLGENSLKLGACNINKTDVFVIGNEGHGVCEETVKNSSETMFIPMCENTESLNASVATAILMWEIFNI